MIFILATTEVHKLLPTILSRCQRFDFKRIAPEAIGERLQKVARLEEAQLDWEAALLIARIADGALRDALSLLDQCLGRDRHVTLEVVSETAGVAARDYLPAFTEAIITGAAAKALELVDSLYRESKDMTRLCEEMTEYFRGLMLIKTMKDPSALLAVSGQELEAMTKKALSMTLPTILHGLDTFEETLQKMRYRNQRAELEMAFVRLCSPELDTSPEALLRRLEALESGMPRKMPSELEKSPEFRKFLAVQEKEPEQQLQEESLSEPERQPSFEDLPPPPEEGEAPPIKPSVSAPPARSSLPPQPAGEDLGLKLSASAQRFLDWPEILQAIKGNAKSVAMAFAGSSAYVNGDYMLIDAPEFAFDLLKLPEQRNFVREAVRNVTGRVYKLGPYRRPAQEEASDFWMTWSVVPEILALRFGKNRTAWKTRNDNIKKG